MKVMLWGAGGNAKLYLKMLEENFKNDFIITGIFENKLKSIPFKTNSPICRTKNELSLLINKSTHFVISIGSNGLARYEISQQLKNKGLKSVNLISKHSILEDLNKYGEGISSMPGSIIHKFTEIGDQCIFNTNSTVDHDCILGNGVHIMGGASIAGRVRIGDFSIVGTNATILPDISIGEKSFIGAGAVVTKNVLDNQVVYGVPARPIKENNICVDLKIFDDL